MGTLPLVSFTLIPEALGMNSVFPAYLTILAWGLLPAFFAFAILQHQMLGIRRLVHRGMVYGLVSLGLVVSVMLALAASTTFLDDASESGYPLTLTSAVLVAAAILLVPLRRGARWLVDRLLYEDIADYGSLLRIVPTGIQGSNRTSDIATTIVGRLTEVLGLEGALLYLRESPTQWSLVARAGENAANVAQRLESELQRYLEQLSVSDLLQVRLESNSLILASISLAGQNAGCLVLGPKKGGEIFLDEERRLISTLTPMLALAIDKSELAQDLRILNHRLMQAEEAERTRIAADLHDGPLQRAILITTDANARESSVTLANLMIAEIREICSRLRPAILDDLGLVSALAWLAANAKRSCVFTSRWDTSPAEYYNEGVSCDSRANGHHGSPFSRSAAHSCNLNAATRYPSQNCVRTPGSQLGSHNFG